MSSGKTEQTVFFGSGPVAAASLERLYQHTKIEAVITKPRPPHHRGSVPVIELASSLNLPIITVSSKKDVDAALTEHAFTSRYGILIDFGIIVGRAAIEHFPLGILNSHFSLLPNLRGADPITWSIVNGDDETGVSLMLIDEGMDTGQLLAQTALKLQHNETTPTLTNSLISLSDLVLQEALPGYLRGEISPYNQPNANSATYSRKLSKADGVINWHEPAATIERKIRGFTDWPQSRTKLGSLDVIITAAHTIDCAGTPGEHIINDKQLLIYAGDKALGIDTLKPAGKKEMPIGAFLAGYKNQL